MKVLDLECALGHPFEGWFASEEDFLHQRHELQVRCPLCDDPSAIKKLSAPRLLLSGVRSDPVPEKDCANGTAVAGGNDPTAAWLAMARQIVAHTTDVGENFAEEARKMYYGEQPERGIRGTATLRETRMLLDEGIAVLPLPIPDGMKKSLQ